LSSGHNYTSDEQDDERLARFRVCSFFDEDTGLSPQALSFIHKLVGSLFWFSTFGYARGLLGCDNPPPVCKLQLELDLLDGESVQALKNNNSSTSAALN
jgi:hypothetical protein